MFKIPHQETGRSKSIADFKKKRYRYQCTPYTVEIERMVEENFHGKIQSHFQDEYDIMINIKRVKIS
ncbi:MAG: DUF2397 family protein [Selenomonas sp.]|nr:DUF2397 family protein [Selenomonas sp.]